jgi:hypothetical protein
MVPKIHKKGVSFKGAAGYLLRDVGNDTSERVAWTEVRNVASRNPEVAWRVMAATAMDQDRLKAQAGVPNTGRKSKQSVFHFSLSWHEEEKADLTREEMMRAANTILAVMEAQEHQALVICHTDKPQPHVHVLVNRVHPQHGKMLSSSFEKLQASRWAQKYEEERGKIYCDQRVVNNAAREREEFTRGKKDEARHVHDAAQVANDNDQRQQLLAEHRKQARALGDAGRQLKQRHAESWSLLEERNRRLQDLIVKRTKEVMARNEQQLRERFRPRWEQRHHERQAALREFEKQEATLWGRMKNAVQAIDLKGLLSREVPLDDGKTRTLSEAFRLLNDSAARLQSLQKQQDAQDRQLKAEQRKIEAEIQQKRQAERDQLLEENRKRFEAERSSLILQQQLEQSMHRARWQEKGRRFRQEVEQLRELEQKKQPERTVTPVRPVEPAEARRQAPPLAQEFAKAAEPEAKREQTENESEAPPKVPTPPPRTNPSDLLPQKDAQQAAQQIDQWEDFVQQRQIRREQRDGRDENRDR